jgi:hypothetical protein
MPRRGKGARLWLRKRRGRRAQWVILDHGQEIGTGASESDIGAAERALIEYLSRKRRPDFGDGHPTRVLIADVLADYGETHGPTTERPDLIGGAITKLLEYFDDEMVASITSARCKKYVEWRIRQFDARSKEKRKPVQASTARRELVVLGAALRWCWKEAKLRPFGSPDSPGAGGAAPASSKPDRGGGFARWCAWLGSTWRPASKQN